MCFLGLDYGDKTIGVSVSGPGGKTAVGVTTLTRQDADGLRPSLKALKAIIKTYGVTHIVLGYPRHLDGSDSKRCEKTLAFKEKLNRYFKSIPVELWDERLSTRAVTRVFEGRRDNYKKHVDEMAAVYILQGFLDKTQAEVREAALPAGVQPQYNQRRMKNMENMEKDMMLENEGDGNVIVLYDDEGNEIALEILSSRQSPSGDATYVLVIEEDDEDEAEVMHFKLLEDGEDTIFELVDEEHEDFDLVLDLFKEDYKTLGVVIDEEI